MENKNVFKIILIIIMTIILFKFTKKKEKFTNNITLTQNDIDNATNLITKINNSKNGNIDVNLIIGGNLSIDENLTIEKHITARGGGFFKETTNNTKYTFEDTERAGRIRIGKVSSHTEPGIESIDSGKSIILGSDSGKIILNGIEISNQNIDVSRLEDTHTAVYVNNIIKKDEDLYYLWNKDTRWTGNASGLHETGSGLKKLINWDPKTWKLGK